jgi:replicative DNA helicase
MNPPEHLIDIEAEQAVLGACLIDPDAVMKIADSLQPADFHDEGHQLIYRCMCELLHEGTQSDYIIVSRKIGRDNWPKLGANGIRGQAYLNQLIEQTPTSLGATRYAKIVSRLSMLRRLMGASGDIAKLAYSANGDRLDDVFTRARSLVDRIAPMASDEAVLLWLDSLDAFFGTQTDRQMEQVAIEEGKATARVDFPFRAISQYINYVRPGMLVAVAAESGVGKTAFLETLAEYWASRQGLNVIFFHLELSHQVMLDRRMARQSGISMKEIEDGAITDAMGEATRRMQRWPGGIHYVHCPGWTAQRITNQARMLKDKGLCDVIIVDYLGLMRSWTYAPSLS